MSDARGRKITESDAVHNEREIAAVVEVQRTTTLDLGPKVSEFEKRIAAPLGKRHGVLVNSGTSALRLAIDLVGCEPGDEIITLQEAFLERGVATRMVWTGNILRQPGFASIEHRAPSGGFPNADVVMDRALTLPIHHSLTSGDIGYLCDVTDEILGAM